MYTSERVVFIYVFKILILYSVINDRKALAFDFRIPLPENVFVNILMGVGRKRHSKVLDQIGFGSATELVKGMKCLNN